MMEDLVPGALTKPFVPVAFAADNAYVPMVTVTAYSMLKNADPAYHYGVMVMHRDITAQNQQIMRGFLHGAI